MSHANVLALRKTAVELVLCLYDHHPYSAQHSHWVGILIREFAKELGYKMSAQVDMVCDLHDIGKLEVPYKILSKEEKLTEKEFGLIELHPVEGDRLLATAGFGEEARAIALYHHERWDGNGYPCGLKGPQIPFIARITAVADAFDAMRSPRAYHESNSTVTSLQELVRCAGTQFDPAIIGPIVKYLNKTGVKL